MCVILSQLFPLRSHLQIFDRDCSALIFGPTLIHVIRFRGYLCRLPLLYSVSNFPCISSEINRMSDSGVYQTPPAPKSLDSSFLSDDLSLFHHHQQQQRDPDQMSVSSTTSSTGGPSPRDRRCEAGSAGIYMPMAAGHGHSHSHSHSHSPGSSSKVSVSFIMLYSTLQC